MHRTLLLCLLCLGSLTAPAAGQELTGFERERDRVMLRAVEHDLRQYYYDTTFHGLALTTLFDSADARIAAATSNGEAFLAIAVTLAALRDSHTRFFPPRRTTDVRYGWTLGVVGDSCYIFDVDPESDAAAQGVKRGDLVIAIDHFAVNRSDRRDVEYVYYVLAPRPVVRLTLQSPGDSVRSTAARAKLTPRPKILDLTHGVGVDVVAFYYTWITEADLVLADGTRLEGRGVVPDEIVLPTGADLARRRDPALARAITLAGHAVTAEEAGNLFPPER